MANDAPVNPPADPPADPSPAPPPAPAAPAPPPAAKAVLDGKTERELILERELEAEKAGRLNAESNAAQAQEQLRASQAAPVPAPNPNKDVKQTYPRGRWTLLGYALGSDE
jgi:hypothetical protein